MMEGNSQGFYDFYSFMYSINHKIWNISSYLWLRDLRLTADSIS